MNILGLNITVDRSASATAKWTRRSLAMAAVTGTVLSTGVAYAFWSSAGSGAGTSTAASAVTATVTAATTTEVGLWPGNATAVPLHFTVNNPNPYAVTYSTFSTAAISNVVGGPLADATHTCGTGDFSLVATSGNLASAVPVGANGTNASVAGTTANILKMNSTAGDGCQGAVVTVTLKVAGTQS